MASVDFKDLNVWQRTFQLTKDIYKLAGELPREEQYGLKSQLLRAAISVPANIAEGQARKGNKEFIQFLYIAKGSLAEVETLLMLGSDLNYFSKEKTLELISEITICNKMLSKLITVIKNKNS